MDNHSFDRVIIYSADRAYEADIIRGILSSNGIILHHMPDYSTGLFGVLVNLHVAIAGNDVEEAREILSAFGIDIEDPLHTYMPHEILRTINHFFPRENRWVKKGAILVLVLWSIGNILQGYFYLYFIAKDLLNF